MSEFYTSMGPVMRQSDIDRDMRLAAEFGRRAAHGESEQPGIFAGSQRMRYEFRRAVLSRYDLSTWPNQDDPAEYVLRLRKAMNRAYYDHYVSDALIGITPTFDPPGDAEVNSFEVEYPPATLEVLSV